MSDGELTVERRGDVALLTLAHEPKRNALTPAMLAALRAAFVELPADGVRAAVLTGAGERAFSSGFDLSALAGLAAAGVPTENPLAPALGALGDGPMPVIAALNGAAIGGGCELAATCDVRVAHEGVTLMMPPARLGIIYDPRGLATFVSLIGQSHTRELFFSARAVGAAEALDWGLVDRVVPAGDVLTTALALAEEMARGAPLAVSGMRRILSQLRPALEPAFAEEARAIMARAWQSRDAAEALLALAERRRPKFTGE